MDRNEFWHRYRQAKEQALSTASEMILEDLPTVHMPFISLPMRQPSTDLAGDERVFDRDDHHRKYGQGHPHEEQEMVDYFWRDGFVPRWIDLSVFSTNGTITVFEFRASDVFTRYSGDAGGSDTDRLKPWAPKAPRAPSGWRSVKESGRFSLNWHLQPGSCL